MPLWPRDLSTVANTTADSASMPDVTHDFEPFKIQKSPSSLAVVAKELTSDPAPYIIHNFSDTCCLVFYF